ncbi:MAG: Gldg family protein [Deltaproteobacteria bacterium]|nr:Gldg family protein [Deltaproteobacteria bacterium]
MALGQENRRPWGCLRGPQVLILYIVGLITIYVGERIVGGHDITRWIVSSAGAAGAIIASLVWVAAWLLTKSEARRIERLAALLSLGGLLGLTIYLLGSDLVMGPALVTKAQQAGVSLRQVFHVAWPIILVCTILPLIFVQVSTSSMAKGRGVEAGRVRASAHAGAVTALFLSTLFFVNALANKKDVHKDLSYFKTTSPSEASQSMVQGLDADTQALLFFPHTNEVLEEILPYFEELDQLSSRFSVEVIDKALEPDLAKQHRISSDGTILLLRGESKQKITLGAKMERAKRSLRKLDAEFQKSMLKMIRNRATVYMITGHGERGPDKTDVDVRPGVLVVKKYLMAKNLTVKHLGPVEGLGNAVPDDAAMLIWIDPSGSLFPGEGDAIQAYLERGGRMLLTLDPDSKAAPNQLLEYLGLDYSTVKLAHDRAYIPIERSKADRYNIVTTSFSNHAAVTTVSRSSRRFPVLLPGSGSLEKAPGSKKKVTFIVRSVPNTWADSDGDIKRGSKERSKVFHLAAAISQKIKKPEPVEQDKNKVPESKEDKKPQDKSKSSKASDSKSAKKPKDKAKKDKKKDKPAPKGTPKGAKEKDDEMRVVVFADSDVFSDKYIGFRLSVNEIGGNMQLLADVLQWLGDEERIPGLPTSEEDIKIVHTRDEDKIWFYGTVFAVPLIILGIGFATRWGRGRSRRAVR